MPAVVVDTDFEKKILVLMRNTIREEVARAIKEEMQKYLPGKLYLVNEQHLVYVNEQKTFYCLRDINQFIVPNERVIETPKNSTENTDSISADTVLKLLAIITNKEKYREL